MQDKPSSSDQVSFEQVLMRDLRAGNIDQDSLRELVGAVATLQKAGLKRLRAFPKGTPNPDGIRVAGTIDIGDAERLLGALARTSRFSGIFLFPYGTPWPEIYRVNVDLGAPIQDATFRGV